VIAGGAFAITYGQLDGNRHPEVGALVGTFSSGTFPYCSGTLISPTVFLTAAHCNIGTSTVNVTFDSQYSSRSKLYTGTYHADPLYGGGQGDAHDIAVVVFSKPISGLTPAQLPAAGLFDRMKADGTLNTRHHDHRRYAVHVDERHLPARHGVGAGLPRPVRDASVS
jgi:hypothetical protein